MSARYTLLPNPDAERELDDAFDAPETDDDNGDHSQPSPSPAIPGAYDFEREYDHPPPGSPPKPTARALPNDYGNSNGLLPTSPLTYSSASRPSIFRRAVGALLPSHYVRVPTQSSLPTGGGIENDGVFANVSAKPHRPAQVSRNPDGSIYIVPEDNQKEAPPVRLDPPWNSPDPPSSHCSRTQMHKPTPYLPIGKPPFMPPPHKIATAT